MAFLTLVTKDKPISLVGLSTVFGCLSERNCVEGRQAGNDFVRGNFLRETGKEVFRSITLIGSNTLSIT